METAKEQVIKGSTEYLMERLNLLLANINNLVDRSHADTCPTVDAGARSTQTNVFDEILENLATCENRANLILEKWQEDIARKVQ